MARRCGRKHRAVQVAVENGRIPRSAVRRDARGRIVAIEYHAAVYAWADSTDFDQALRSAAPLRLPPAPPAAVQTSGLDADQREALILGPALEVAVLSVPTILAKLGASPAFVTAAIEQLMDCMAAELVARRVDAALTAELVEGIRGMVLEERDHPGSYTT